MASKSGAGKGSKPRKVDGDKYRDNFSKIKFPDKKKSKEN